MMCKLRLVFIWRSLRCRCLSTSSTVERRFGMFYEKDEKGGYREEKPFSLRDELAHIDMKRGLGDLKREVLLWKDEWAEKLTDDPPMVLPGTSDIIWKFDNTQMLEKWVVTSDKDHNEGFSECALIINKNKKGLFYGHLNKNVPKDGRAKRAGYCNMRSLRPRRSFLRDSCYDWTLFTHLLMRVRGDGRSYMITLGSAGHFDIMWNDIYSFVLYTRGGPYWQLSKIPFSRFYLSSKGRVQDKQAPVTLNNITSFGISCGDRIPGPFQLEIDFIGLHYDPSHTEETAYETYATPKYIVGT